MKYSNELPEVPRQVSSADFKSAVSPTCSRQTIGFTERARIDGGMRIANPRYSRLEICATLAFAIGCANVVAAVSETPDQTAAVLAQKALTNSGAMEIVTDLTTGIGPRLAGSDAEKRAAAWAKQRFEQLGFDKVWIETFPLEHGWARGLEQAEIISPSPQPRPPNEISL